MTSLVPTHCLTSNALLTDQPCIHARYEQPRIESQTDQPRIHSLTDPPLSVSEGVRACECVCVREGEGGREREGGREGGGVAASFSAAAIALG